MVTSTEILTSTYFLIMIVWGYNVVWEYLKYSTEHASWWWLFPVIAFWPYSMWVYKRNCEGNPVPTPWRKKKKIRW